MAALTPVVFHPGGYDAFLLPKKTFLIFVVALSLACYIARACHERVFCLPSPSLMFPLALYGLYLSGSSLFSPYFALAIPYAGYVLSLLALTFLVSMLEEDDRLVFFRFFGLACLLSAGYGLAQRLGWDPTPWTEATRHRPTGFSGNPVFFGGVLAASLPLFLYRQKPMHPAWDLVHGAALSLVLLGVFFSFSRAAWGAAAVALAASLFALRAEPAAWRRAGAGLLLFFILALPFAGQAVPIDKEGEVGLRGRLKIASVSGQVRHYLWGDAGKLFSDRPLTGWGPGAFTAAYPHRRSEEILRLQALTALPEDAHNIVLHLLATEGIVGTGLFFWLLAAAFVSFRRRPAAVPAKVAGAAAGALAFPLLFQPLFPDQAVLLFALVGSAAPRRRLCPAASLPVGVVLLLLGFFLLLFVPKLFTPLVADTVFLRAQAALRSEAYDRGIPLLERALILTSDPRHLRETAKIYWKVGERSRQPSLFQAAFDLYAGLETNIPWDGSLYWEWGQAMERYAYHVDRQAYPKTERLYLKAIARDPKFAIFHNDLGIAYLNMGLFRKAEKAFYTAIQLVPAYGDPWHNLAVLRLRQGRLAPALAYAREAYRLLPDDPQIRAHYERIRAEAERPPGAGER